MLENWLKPLDTDQFINSANLSSFQFGKNIKQYTNELPNLSDCKIALVGVGEGANLVRHYLYQLRALSSPEYKIVDLGNVRNPQTNGISPAIKELLLGGFIPILIGGADSFPLVQYQSYKFMDELINMVVLNDRINYSLDSFISKQDFYYLNQILTGNYLFNLSIIGYQSHYTNPEVLSYFQKMHYELIRLGHIQQSIELAEPIVRDADFLSIDLSCLKQSEAPANKYASPAGFSHEQVCQIARYAGMSDKLSSLGFFNYDTTKDINDQTAQSIAQMIWYFAEGFYNRKQDYPMSASNFVEYIVELKDWNQAITFWKSVKSSRWWMEVPVPSNKKQERHRLISCTYEDYQQACRNEMPERLLNAFKRFA